MDFKALQRERNFKQQLKKEEMWVSKSDNWLDDESGGEEDDLDEEDKIEFEADPHYNENADDKDADWVAKNLEKYLEGVPTDAILNCPCCFALVTLHCQRHETHLNQYRSMFVRNCKVLKEKEFRYKKVQSKSKKSKQKSKANTTNSTVNNNKQETSEGMEIAIPSPSTEQKDFEYIDRIYVEDEHLYENEIYAPVVCSFCNTEIGVFEDDVYHFHNCVPGN